ncbi:MAG: sulfurtransferase [Gammaproteobacteria bacterium]|nr:sulfurtransferase [Gammaproteobacteria bacterium]MBU2479411.1 sulfurtransferase [Gammaproteobacteria bacterium]
MERTITPDALKAKLDELYILDARRPSDLAASSEKLPGAQWQDPEKITEWLPQLPKDKDIVLYCVRGGSVSNGVVDALQAQGFKARFIEGGIEGWKAAGGQTQSK